VSAARYRGRFAPSPTGPLHPGSLAAAVASYLDARAVRGEWLLRIEDVDTPRSVPGAADAILRTLDSLGLHWDAGVVLQSTRRERYEAALQSLRAHGLLYRCRCSRREIADSALRGIEGAVYPGTCRALALGAAVDGAERFRVPAGGIAFEDRLRGTLVQDVARDVGDFVVKRRDGLHAYQLAVVLDDADAGVTDVVRGADLLWSTPRQVLLQSALGFATPRYLHVPVVTDEHGEKLSKQAHATPVVDGDPGALRAALRFLGQPWELPGSPREILDAAAESWNDAALRGRDTM
jgi:glutamyl-Q tRNA(Asp) synthetase